MGCFLGCFGGEKDHKRRKQRINRGSPQRQRNRVQNVAQQENIVIAEQSIKEAITVQNVAQQENILIAEQSIKEAITTNLVSELPTPTEVVEQQPSPNSSPNRSPKKKVTFNSNITTYEHVSVQDSIESLPEPTTNIGKEKQGHSKMSTQSRSISEEDENSVSSSLASFPSNHRYHNARDSDDEEVDESDLDDLDDDYEDDYEDEDEDIDIDAKISGHEVWTESVESPMMSDESIKKFDSETNNARDRSDYINSVLNPVENVTQWKAVKSKGTHLLKPQKENLTTAEFESPRLSFSSEPTFKKKPDNSKNVNREVAVDASLSNWLGSPEITTPSKKASFSGFETSNTSEGRNSVRSFEDRPILGALTVEELRQMSASNSPRKSPSRSPEDMPIIGSVGTYWNDSSISKKSTDSSVSSFKGIPNTTSKYREDKRVNWHSTPFETRLDRALNRGAAEA
ncbi:hypothetical protein CASFOL_008675 [Castilleja foliolosa]|uniref:Uncharacterized protein n=1 Tax=Castilleja foliolosa TaxID=1961234 RepID=A0ABD3E1M9_9LAMI